MVTPRQPERLEVEGGHVPLVGALAMRRPGWWSSAACKGHDLKLFFPDPRSTNYDAARAICSSCPVIEPCLAAALERGDQFGMFGGKSPQERKELQRKGARSLGGTTPPTPTAVDGRPPPEGAGGSPVLRPDGFQPTPSLSSAVYSPLDESDPLKGHDNASTTPKPAA
jgi:WhiB family redox-sensing transcriptional regulator